MKRTSLFTLVTILVLGVTTLQSCFKDHLQPDPARAQLQQLTDSLYQHFNEKWDLEKNKGGFFLQVNNPSGSTLVSTNIEPGVQGNTHYRIASLSKIFTSAAILLLQQEGKLTITDYIPDYLPVTPAYDIPNKNQITIKQLLQHRAGVFDITNQDIPTTVSQPYAGKRYIDYIRDDLNQETHTFTFDELVGVVAQNQLSNFAPGTTFQYSNTGYNLLGKIIEKASGVSYSDFIRTRFLEPLQLTNTYNVWQGTDTRMKDPFVNSYLLVPGQSPIDTPEDNMSMNVTEGDMVSSPDDITRWIELLLTGKAGLTPQSIALMEEMEIADASHGVYGLGLTFNDGMGFGHDGAHLSYISTLRYNPVTKTTVLMVANFIKTNTTPETNFNDFLELALGVRNTALRAAQVANK
ncbi:serine hydrolase domain-containing protein [Larkinella punicea]|uniref:Class A beta-lactamase-related serine hydrolase n=1 Tax=Larkinella punicea TaxID=2315727 RepID=A0A368JGX4_9BACT|nr:serine hydrolase domain-containing protein [Larkinella punicea]RCR66920.1 class A beta-lactamase-related serine hydrolase [Larkinella punicea]